MIEDVWLDFVRYRRPADREKLILHYQPLVRKTAYQLLRKLPSHFEIEDLVSYGQFGLIDAINRFDPSMGFQMETFASTRVRGAMLDELRTQDWAPRRVRATAREIDTVTDVLDRELGRRPTLAEVAERIGCDEAELVAAQAEAASSMLGSLDGVPEWSEREDHSVSDYALDAEIAATREAMARAISFLPAQEQAIIRMYYVEGLRMREIGRMLGLGESRACAAHARAALMLRERLVLAR